MLTFFGNSVAFFFLLCRIIKKINFTRIQYYFCVKLIVFCAGQSLIIQKHTKKPNPSIILFKKPSVTWNAFKIQKTYTYGLSFLIFFVSFKLPFFYMEQETRWHHGQRAISTPHRVVVVVCFLVRHCISFHAVPLVTQKYKSIPSNCKVNPPKR